MIRPRKSVFEQLLQLGLRVRPPHRDVLLLHLAEQPLDPALQLPFELGAVDDQDHGRVLEPLLLLEDQPRRGQQGEGLARALRVPDEAALLAGSAQRATILSMARR